MSKFTLHNGIQSPTVNDTITFTVPVVFAGGLTGNVGQTLFVDADGPLGGNGVLPESPFRSIQDALDVASEGAVIVIQPGEYDENLVVSTDYITLVGAQGGYGRPDLVATTGVVLTVSAQGFRAFRCRFAATDDDAVVQEGNGFEYNDCVFDGDSGQAATDALLRLKGNASDDSMTASEGVVRDCMFRGSDGFGILFDTGDAPGNGVGCTHDVVDSCRFIDNVAADLATADTGSGVYSVQDTLIERCQFMEPKNKATWIDFTTSNGGAAGDQTGAISDCYFNDDTVDTTAVAIVGTGWGVVGCHSMDGEFDGSGLD